MPLTKQSVWGIHFGCFCSAESVQSHFAVIEVKGQRGVKRCKSEK